MKLLRYVANLGYGTRREVTRLLADGRVTRRDGTILDALTEAVHEEVLIDGEPLDPPPNAMLLLHKPVGYVCSSTGLEPLVYDLLPSRFLRRSPLMAAVGRLDRGTSGLLLFTDDGRLNHRVTSPRTHLPKIYDASLANDLRGDEVERFGDGTLMLAGETHALAPASLEVRGPRHVRVTLSEGRYHQVRRMFAALGNHVVSLHRIAIGGLSLGPLPEAHWRVLAPAEISAIWSPPIP